MKKYIDLLDMVNVNCSNVLNIIQKNGFVSRKEITDLSGLSWGGMTKIVNKLLEKEYIKEEKPEKASTSGRIAGVLSVNKDKNFVIGLDINKTGLKATVVNLAGEPLRNYECPVDARTKENFLDEIKAFCKGIFKDFPKDTIISMGVAMQGIVEFKKGISIKFPGIFDWNNVPIKEILENEFSVNVFVEHDPDCLLYPHIRQGIKENIVLLRIDKSVGMAAAINSKIIKGKGILEIAHNIIVPNGAECDCGQTGCLEAYVKPCIENGRINTLKVDELITPLAISIKNMLGVFNADRIILTGALMEYKDLFSERLEKKLLSIGCETKIEFSDTSDLSAKGAALIAVNLSINSLLI